MKIRFLTGGYRYYFTCLLSIAVLCGLVSDGHTQNYYPDDVGNTWTLHSIDGIDERVVKIEGTETIGTELVKVISDRTYPVSDPASNNPNKFFIKATPNRVLIFRATARVQGFDFTIDYSPPETFLPIPIKKGSEWTVTGEARLGVIPIEVINAAKVVEIEDVTVPAGTFHDCLKIEQELSTSGLVKLSTQSTMWLAPDIGIVKAINSSNVIFELIDHNIPIDGPVVAVEPKGKLTTTWAALKKR